jgi:hypothetical protein
LSDYFSAGSDVCLGKIPHIFVAGWMASAPMTVEMGDIILGVTVKASIIERRLGAGEFGFGRRAR